MRTVVIAMVLVASAHANIASAQLNSPGEEPSDTEPAYPVEDTWTPPPSEPAPSNLGGAGESCRARADCESGLRCVANVCRDPLEGTACGASAECGPQLRCIQQVCQSPLMVNSFTGAAAAPREPEAPGDGRVSIDGVHGFIGVSTMVGPTLGSYSYFDGAFLGAVRAGVYAGLNELAVEITPFSTVYSFEVPVFQLNVSYAVLLPMVRGSNVAVYWPLRFGAGFLTGNTGGNVYVEGRADLVGIAIQVGRFMIDLHLPSFRVAWTPGSTYSRYGYGVSGSTMLFSWFGGASFSYMF